MQGTHYLIDLGPLLFDEHLFRLMIPGYLFFAPRYTLQLLHLLLLIGALPAEAKPGAVQAAQEIAYTLLGRAGKLPEGKHDPACSNAEIMAYLAAFPALLNTPLLATEKGTLAEYPSTPLCLAILATDRLLVAELIAQPGLHLNKCSSAGISPLYLAIEEVGKARREGQGQKQAEALAIVAQLVVREGLALNQKGPGDCTPLHAAVLANEPGIVARLLAHKGCSLESLNTAGETPFYLALRRMVTYQEEGRLQEVQLSKSVLELFLAQPDIAVPRAWPMGWSPLHLAVLARDREVVAWLLARGFRATRLTEEGDTPLLLALARMEAYRRQGKWAEREALRQVLPLLIKAPGIDLQQMGAQGHTALHAAIQAGDVATVSALLGQDQCDPNLPNAHGASPLYLALTLALAHKKAGHTQEAEQARRIVLLLLALSTVELNAPGPDGQTPFHLALRVGDTEVVHTFLAQEALELNKATSQGVTPLLMAIDLVGQHRAAGHTQEAQQLKQLIGMLLAQAPRVGPNKPGPEGVAPLHLAIALGEPWIVQGLLETPGIDPNAPIQGQHTPLFLALEVMATHRKAKKREALEEGKAIVALLLEQPGVDPCREGPQGTALLHAAIYTYDPEVVSWVLAQPGLAYNTTNATGQTPLLFAMQLAREAKSVGDIVAVDQLLEITHRLLAQPQVDVNTTHSHGLTPLHAAIQLCDEATVQHLLARKELDLTGTLEVKRKIWLLGWERTCAYDALALAKEAHTTCTQQLEACPAIDPLLISLQVDQQALAKIIALLEAAQPGQAGEGSPS